MIYRRLPIIVNVPVAPSTPVPTDIDGCVLWLDVNDPATILKSRSPDTPAEDGDAIAAWLDKSIGARHLTQSTANLRPTLDSDGGPDGGSSVYLAGTTNRILASAPASWGVNEYTILFAFALHVDGGHIQYSTPFAIGAYTDHTAVFVDRTPPKLVFWSRFSGTGDDVGTTAPQLTHAVWHFACLRRSASGVTFTQDDFVTYSAGVGSVPASSNFSATIGLAGVASKLWVGSIACYDRSLSSDEILSIKPNIIPA